MKKVRCSPAEALFRLPSPLHVTDETVSGFGSPVDCIHWVTAAQLTLLEDEMRRIERVNVSTLDLT